MTRHDECNLQRPVSSVRLCLHCGASVPMRETSPFCCRGCESVHALLRERGLEAYYSLRNRAQGTHGALPANSVVEGFSYLDDAEFLRDYSFDQGRQMKFYLEGVHCAACVWLTEKLPEFDSGVESLRLNLASSVATVRIREGGSFASAAEEIVRLGYRPHPVRQEESDDLRKRESRKNLIQLGVAGMLAGNIMLLAVALYAGAEGGLKAVFRWTSFLLFIPVFFYSAIPFYSGALASLRKKQVSIDVPIVFGILVGTLASIGNLFVGVEHIYFDSLSALVFLLLSTRYLLRKVNQHSLEASKVMHFLAPSKAHRWEPGTRTYVDVQTDALREGDLIQVFPGECFPVDGEVVSGESVVSCALLTGESAPQSVLAGTRVNAGTSNQQAPLQVRVVSTGAGTRLGKILAAMEQSLTAKAPIVSFLDRVGQAFVGAVLGLTFLGFLLGLSVSWHEAINRALAVAIVVCPCTFALATPLAMSLAIGRAARAGVVVKGADVLERLSQVTTVFFDKTGTLTQGSPQVTAWEERIPGTLHALIALESRSVHPVAKAILRHFPLYPGDRIPPVDGFVEKAGVGVSGVVNGSIYEVRSESSEVAGTRVVVMRDGELAASLTVVDEVRADSRDAIQGFKDLGLDVRVLSGDQVRPVQEVAALVGISPERAVARAGPEQKKEILASCPKSLMVGDGANDAVALAAAHASVAVQGGMEMSILASGAYSTAAGIMPVHRLVVIARETMKVIRRNLVFAILYNVIGTLIALTGNLDPLLAAVLMPLSALSVFLSTIAGTHRLRAVAP